MSDEQTTVRGHDVVFGMNSRAARLIALWLLVLLVGVRAAGELAMMREHGPDAQMGIWNVFLVVKLALWFVAD